MTNANSHKLLNKSIHEYRNKRLKEYLKEYTWVLPSISIILKGCQFGSFKFSCHKEHSVEACTFASSRGNRCLHVF
jgi:hypothetical protein